MNRLPHDYCRCAGHNCARKSECLRVAAMEDMGERTPWTERLCAMGRESESFIAIRDESMKLAQATP